MDKCWVTGIGQDADWWIGVWDDTRPDDDQPNRPSCSSTLGDLLGFEAPVAA